MIGDVGDKPTLGVPVACMIPLWSVKYSLSSAGPVALRTLIHQRHCRVFAPR